MLQRLARVFEGGGRPVFLSSVKKSSSLSFAIARSCGFKKGETFCNMSSKSKPLPSSLPIEVSSVIFSNNPNFFFTQGSADLGGLWDDWSWGGERRATGDCCCGHWGDCYMLARIWFCWYWPWIKKYSHGDDQGDTLEQVAATESIIISTPKDVLDKMNSWYILHVQPSVLPQLQFCFTQGVSDSTESQD